MEFTPISVLFCVALLLVAGFVLHLLMPREPAEVVAQPNGGAAIAAPAPKTPWSAPTMGLFGGIGMFCASCLCFRPALDGILLPLFLAFSIAGGLLCSALAGGALTLRVRAARREAPELSLSRILAREAVIAVPIAIIATATLSALAHLYLWC
jgi:hypothetical protein